MNCMATSICAVIRVNRNFRLHGLCLSKALTPGIQNIASDPFRHKNTLRSTNVNRTLNRHFSHSTHRMSSLENLNFDNLVLRTLPIDPLQENRPRQVKGACFSIVDPTPVTHPQTVAVSQSALDLIDLPKAEVEKEDFAAYFAGSKVLPGARPAAHCYCGHQFGQFAGQLGDGATMYLGEVVNTHGERWELQLKGAGLTPYSRTADGRKVLRSSIREFLCSEAMHHLGIPTTRAGSCVTSDSKVIRDIHYSGNPIEERCTVISRIAQTFLRFGSFQICKPPDRQTGRDGPSVGMIDILAQMVDYVTENFYPQIWASHQSDKQTLCVEFFRAVVHKTAKLVAKWQSVGWCHGVLNTDNMSIAGLTIDYGPYGFMDRYDPEFICNASDNNGRYTYAAQPSVCEWNLERLLEALALQAHMDRESMYPALKEYQGVYKEEYRGIMRRKFGLEKSLPEDDALFSSFYSTMYQTGADFTNSFRSLSALGLPGTCYHGDSVRDVTDRLLDQCCPLEELVKAHKPRMDPRQLQMLLMMAEMNPDLLAQLGAGQRAIRDEIERLEKVKALKEKTPEAKLSEDREAWTQWLGEYVTRLGRDVEGSTEPLDVMDRRRKDTMDATNPRFILRNYIAQNAIDAAETGDYSEVQRVLRLLEDPYSESTELCDADTRDPRAPDQRSSSTEGSPVDPPVAQNTPSGGQRQAYDSRPPGWAADLRVT